MKTHTTAKCLLLTLSLSCSLRNLYAESFYDPSEKTLPYDRVQKEEEDEGSEFSWKRLLQLSAFGAVAGATGTAGLFLAGWKPEENAKKRIEKYKFAEKAGMDEVRDQARAQARAEVAVQYGYGTRVPEGDDRVHDRTLAPGVEFESDAKREEFKKAMSNYDTSSSHPNGGRTRFDIGGSNEHYLIKKVDSKVSALEENLKKQKHVSIEGEGWFGYDKEMKLTTLIDDNDPVKGKNSDVADPSTVRYNSVLGGAAVGAAIPASLYIGKHLFWPSIKSWGKSVWNSMTGGGKQEEALSDEGV